MAQVKEAVPPCPESTADLRRQLHQLVDQIADWCEQCDSRLFSMEKRLLDEVRALGRLFLALFLLVRQQRLHDRQQKYPGCWRYPDLVPRTLRTSFGKVRYQRDYWVRRWGQGGFHPLDEELGLTRDGFSPVVISLACRLSSYLSYAKTTLILRAFWGWSPSTETVEQWVLGVGQQAAAYMASSPPLAQPEGEVLVIEVDGKAVPTATDEELSKRRGPRRHDPTCTCGCQRHRGQSKREARGSKKRRKRGDKSKNGRSATLVAIYTLKMGPDGRLHGPVNKRIWGSFASRKAMLAWIRAEATRRGFGPKSAGLVQIVVDGEKCLAKRLRKLFPKAVVTLDIRHVEERLWTAGRAFYAEGSAELAGWVNELRDVLYQSGRKLVARLRQLREGIACRGPGTKRKRAALDSLLGYLEPRRNMMHYGKWIQQDLVIATGVIEGAVRYVIGERMDCGGMRWIRGKAEAILQLRCIEVNGLWDHFFDWCLDRWAEKLRCHETVQIRTDKPLKLEEAA